MAEHLTVPEERIGLELDEFLCLAYPWVNKGFIRTQVRAGKVLVDGQPSQPGHRLRTNEVISVLFEDDELPRTPIPPTEPVTVLHEDPSVLVVDKPAGLAVEPERWMRDAASLSGALVQLAVDRSDPEAPRGGELEYRPRLVHRIDKDTTGAVLVAKDLEAERSLRAAFEAGTVDKRYWALVEGELRLPEGEEEWVIEAPIAPDPRKNGRMRVHKDGKPSRTRVRPVEAFRGHTLVECALDTGRTHQIRVHLSNEGFPLTVDPLYGRRGQLLLSDVKDDYRAKRGQPERPLIDRLTLHARSVEWDAPHDPGRRVRVESPLPKDFERLLKQLRKVRPPRRRT